MGSVNQQFLLYTLIVLLGYFIKRINLISEKEGEVLTKVVLNVTLPALIITALSMMTFEVSLTVLPLISVIYGAVIALFAVWYYRKQPYLTRGMLTMMIPGGNIGLFAFPFVEALLGRESLHYLALMDIGNTIVIFVFVNYLACYFSPCGASLGVKTMTKQILKSMPLMAYLVTIAIRMAGFQYPDLFLDLAQTIAKANMPLSLLFLGIFLNFRLKKGQAGRLLNVFGVRYVPGLLVGLALYYLLPFNAAFRAIVLLYFILPPPSVLIPFAVRFQYDTKFTGTVVNSANAFSYVLMWLAFNFLL